MKKITLGALTLLLITTAVEMTVILSLLNQPPILLLPLYIPV